VSVTQIKCHVLLSLSHSKSHIPNYKLGRHITFSNKYSKPLVILTEGGDVIQIKR
jgi:hypothetical protein